MLSKTINIKKKVCIISATPLTIYFFLKPHIIALSDNFEVTIVFDANNDSYIGDIGVPVKIVSIGMARKINLLRDLKSLVNLFWFFKNNHFDLVITVAPKAGFLSMVAATFSSSANRLHIFQGEFWASKKGLLRLILKFSDLITAFLAHYLIAVSATEKQFLIDNKITHPEKIQVIGQGSIGGVDISKFRFSSEDRHNIRNDLAINQDATVVLFLGRVVADKGIFELADAFLLNLSRCQNLYLIIAGPDEEQIKSELICRLGKSIDRVRFVGFTRHPEKYMSVADFFCLPSYREGFPISILEASAVGIPTIGSNIYGISDAINDGKTGILVNARSSLELSEAISLLYHNISLRKILGENAKVRAHSLYRQDIVVKNYVNYFTQVTINMNGKLFFIRIKRAFDILLSSIFLFFFAFPMLLISIGVYISSKGPIIYWSDRVGKNNELFKMAKFRSMRIDTPILSTDLLSNPRQFITPVGNFLRKFSLDELPQLWNILKGDMSFVGPRPALFNQKSLITMRTQAGVHILKPGLTGWAQINGRDQISDVEKVRFDVFYLQNATIIFDIKILWHTLFRVLRREGVIH